MIELLTINVLSKKEMFKDNFEHKKSPTKRPGFHMKLNLFYLTIAVKEAFSMYFMNSLSFAALALNAPSLAIAFFKLLTIPSNLSSRAEAIALR